MERRASAAVFCGIFLSVRFLNMAVPITDRIRCPPLLCSAFSQTM
jgi:hypothetical protein